MVLVLRCCYDWVWGVTGGAVVCDGTAGAAMCMLATCVCLLRLCVCVAGDAWSDLREEFRHRATYRMLEQLMDEEAINTVLSEQLSLKLMHFEHLEGAPSQVVSQLMLSAYVDNFDYFYQVCTYSALIHSVSCTPRAALIVRCVGMLPALPLQSQ